MPKEKIKTSGQFDVIVGWSAGTVQVASVMADPKTSNEPQNLLELVTSWGHEASDPDHPNGATGLYSSLSRSEINRLIKALRDARDSAYGRDA